MPKVENYQFDEKVIHGVMVKITTYQITDRFHCHVENKDPGATIARAEGKSREEAMRLAMAKASEKLL
ncbi:MAG: hypothetical protein ACE5HI_14405 [bacterium]